MECKNKHTDLERNKPGKNLWKTVIEEQSGNGSKRKRVPGQEVGGYSGPVLGTLLIGTN